jgi:chorismate mutase/prephenate dehydratase
MGDREELALLEKMAEGDLPAETIKSVFREVHAATFSFERPARVVYVGPEGGFGQIAAQQHFGMSSNFAVAETSDLAVDEVARQRADFAVIPFESSVEGPLQTSVEALSNTELSLAAKIEVVAKLSVMAKNVALPTIERLYVYAPDRLATQKYMAQRPAALVVDVLSPLAACQMSLQDPSAAALVPQPLGEQSGLVILESNDGDRADLRIRYGLVASRPTQRSGSDTTALLFGVHDAPGALFDVLKHFAERGINLKTIQSRPKQGENWNYLFYVEVSGHVTDRAVVTALGEIKRETRLLKVLGSFPSC